MKSKFMPLVVIFLQLSIISHITSCARQIIIPKEIDIIPSSLGNKIPLKAGLYLSGSFRNANYPASYKQKVHQSIPVGDTFCNASKKIINNIFHEIIILDSMGSTSESTSKKYEVMIAPEVVRLEYYADLSTMPHRCIVQTVIKWNILSSGGKEIYVSTINSDEVKMRLYKFRDAEECIKLSIKSNFQRAQEDIYSSGWWKKQWWKNSN